VIYTKCPPFWGLSDSIFFSCFMLLAQQTVDKGSRCFGPKMGRLRKPRLPWSNSGRASDMKPTQENCGRSILSCDSSIKITQWYCDKALNAYNWFHNFLRLRSAAKLVASVLGKKGSQRASARLRALFTSGLDHNLFARSRYKTSHKTSCRVAILIAKWDR